MSVVSTRYGKMRIIDADSVISHALALYGEWSMDELSLLAKIIMPGMCVLDIGAFIGTHTLAFSAFTGHKGKVYSFEPRKEIYDVLSENVVINELKNVIANNIGLSDKEDVLNLHPLDISHAINFGGLTLAENEGSFSSNTYQVRVSTIDSFGIEKVDVIKLDVEGMERKVLDGAVNTVLRDRPIVFCECNSVSSGSEVLEFCQSKQYDTFGFLASAYNPGNFNSIKENIFGSAKELALILIPREKVTGILGKITGVNLLLIKSLDDLVLPLLHKPQYAYEVLSHTASCPLLGINFPSPAVIELDNQVAALNRGTLERDSQIAERDSQIAERDSQIAERDSQIEKIIRSKSWLMTKPLRWLGRVCRGEFGTAIEPFRKSITLNDKAVITQHEESRVKVSLAEAFVIPLPIKSTHPTAVILPVYRGVEMTKRCILAAMPGILATPKAKLLVVNDASPDEGMQEMLEQLATQWLDRFLLLKNERNLGFVRTVNRGLAHFSQFDVVLLNSDVIVPKDWLSRLIEEAYSRPNVATVTPFSNNATICSFPYFSHENLQPFNLDVDAIDKIFRHERLPCIEAPTGVGFCMYVRRACLDNIGYLNEEKFGRGYGEENDLCQRALKRGWINIITPNIYAYHEGGVSFSLDKQVLVDRAMRVIDELHPNYHADVHKFIKTDPAKFSRVTRYVQLLNTTPVPKVLHVSHSLGGGVRQHIDELAEYYGQRSANLLLAPHGKNGEVSISLGISQYADSLIFSMPEGYVDIVGLLKEIGVSAVHFHHTHGLDPIILQLPSDLKVTRVLTVHDFYWLNANPTLTDETGRYSGSYSDVINNPLYPLPYGVNVHKWQENLRSFIEDADCVIFPSNSTKALFDNVYRTVNLVVAPHINIELNDASQVGSMVKKDTYIVGVLGALGREKGADLLEKLADKMKGEASRIKFKLIGYSYRPLNFVETTGPYETKDLKELIQRHGLDVVLFTALWPETYSYTLSYALDSGLPIVAPNVGVFPERLSGRTNTMLFNHLSPVSELVEQLNVFIDSVVKKDIVKAPVFEHDNSIHDFYSHDYLNIVSRDLKTVKVDNLNQLNLHTFHIISGGMENKSSSWRGTLAHILWRLHINPYLRWINRAIPFKVKRTVRRLLSNSSIHDIARGSRDK